MPEGLRDRRVTLRSGHEAIEFAFEPGRFEIVAPAAATDTRALDDEALVASLASPIGSPPLTARVDASDRVCIVVPDATRASASDRVAQAVVDALAGCGVPDSRIEFLVGCGTHRAPTPVEIDAIVGPALVRRIAVHVHDAYDAASLVHIGTTSRGTPVELSRRLLDADRVVLVGAIGFHYFAGFSGGRKAVLPACASERAVQANHLLGFDRVSLARAQGVETARLDGNPVSEDMEESCAFLNPTFLANTVVGSGHEITAFYCGDWHEAHRRGCSEYLQAHAVEVTEQRPVVVVSCGGAPRDINMIQAHKALEHARRVLQDGGDLVLLAACNDGLGRADFLDWFVPGGAAATARLLQDGYKVNGQTAWGIRWKSERYRVHLVSALDADVVRRMGMIPHVTLAEAIAVCGDGPGYVIPHGLATLPVLRPAGVQSATRRD